MEYKRCVLKCIFRTLSRQQRGPRKVDDLLEEYIMYINGEGRVKLIGPLKNYCSIEFVLAWYNVEKTTGWCVLCGVLVIDSKVMQCSL